MTAGKRAQCSRFHALSALGDDRAPARDLPVVGKFRVPTGTASTAQGRLLAMIRVAGGVESSAAKPVQAVRVAPEAFPIFPKRCPLAEYNAVVEQKAGS